MQEIISTPGAPPAIGPYSQAVATSDFVFVSGQIAIDPASNQPVTGDIERETEQVMENIRAILEAAGLGFRNIVKASIFLKDMDDFSRVNQVYSSYFTPPYPARETVQVAKLPKDMRIEISVIAAR